jgi:hypothetical protein
MNLISQRYLVKLAILAFLSLGFFGCAKPLPELVSCSPPVIYLQDIPEPQFRGSTNHDLAIHILDLREALKLSNADKKNLRDWLESRQN